MKDVKIFLRDINQEVVDAWTNEFFLMNKKSNYNIFDISCGDILSINADVIISPANSFGRMDGGIDLAYRNKFGIKLENELMKKIRKEYYGELVVGNALIIETGDKQIPYMISAPTMRTPSMINGTKNAYLAFRASLIEIDKFNKKDNQQKIKSVLCPGLGTATGHIGYRNCASQMRMAYDEFIENELMRDLK